MQAPLVSVLLPTYERAEFLSDSIRSVLAQSFGELELIVIDDGSTDASDRVLQSWSADPRLRVIRQPHAGCTAALNTGLKAARGTYVARNDSDDEWLPDWLAVLVPALAAQPEAGFAYARCAGMRADGTPFGAVRGGPMRYPDDPFRSLLFADYTTSIATLYRRACIERVGGFDPQVGPSEDWDMALRVAREFPVVFVDRVVARWREHPGNMTSPYAAGREQALRDRRRVLDKIFERPDVSVSARRMRAVAYRNVHIGSAMQLLSIGERRAALSALREAYAAAGQPVATSARIAWSIAWWFGVSRWPPAVRACQAVLRHTRMVRTAGRVPSASAPDSMA
ncbi:MAG: glycosyltransferase family 2 protein [Candidatus Binatia bacterium]